MSNEQSKAKVEKKDNTSLEVKKEYKVNIKYIEFVKTTIEKKLVEANKEVLVKLYNEIVKLKSNNIKRVNSRVLRKEVKIGVTTYLQDNFKIEYKDFKEASNKIAAKICESRSLNYIKV